MSRASTSFVLGYHGCARSVGRAAVLGDTVLVPQDRTYHWLGSGIYFWENDPHRALEWAREKSSRGELEDPFVIGAILDLRNCLDLQARENVELLKTAYDDLVVLTSKNGLKMPRNKIAKKDKRPEKVLRFLDCAVINHLHSMTNNEFDSVRGLFIEGAAIYPEGEFYVKTHLEIAVRNKSCIVGLFIPQQRI